MLSSVGRAGLVWGGALRAEKVVIGASILCGVGVLSHCKVERWGVAAPAVSGRVVVLADTTVILLIVMLVLIVKRLLMI